VKCDQLSIRKLQHYELFNFISGSLFLTDFAGYFFSKKQTLTFTYE